MHRGPASPPAGGARHLGGACRQPLVGLGKIRKGGAPQGVPPRLDRRGPGRVDRANLLPMAGAAAQDAPFQHERAFGRLDHLQQRHLVWWAREPVSPVAPRLRLRQPCLGQEPQHLRGVAHRQRHGLGHLPDLQVTAVTTQPGQAERSTDGVVAAARQGKVHRTSVGGLLAPDNTALRDRTGAARMSRSPWIPRGLHDGAPTGAAVALRPWGESPEWRSNVRTGRWRMRKYIIMGVQGSGKGTQAKLLAETLDLEHISVGDIFRWNVQHHTKLGAQVRRVVAAGELVSDGVVEERILSRRLCSGCGLDYNLISHRPAVPGVCDMCGAELVPRPDDTPEAVRARLHHYHAKTRPVLDLFRAKEVVVAIDATRPPAAVQANLRADLGVGAVSA